MLKVLVSLISIWIILRDFQFHRISNMSTAFLGFLLLFTRSSLGVTETVITIAVIILIFLLLSIGMGDVKLAIVLIGTEGTMIVSERYLFLMALTLLMTLITSIAIRRNLKGSVAFSHVMLLPFLATYLAI